MLNYVFWGLLAAAMVATAKAESPPYVISTFGQEVSRQFGMAEGLPSLNVRQVAIAADGTVYAATDKGLARFAGEKWVEVPEAKASAWEALGNAGGDVLGVCGRKVFRVTAQGVSHAFSLAHKVPPVTRITGDGTRIFVATEEGLYVFDSQGKEVDSLEKFGAVAQVVGGGLVAGADGAMLRKGDKDWVRVAAKDGEGRAWGVEEVTACAISEQGDQWLAMKAGLALHEDGAQDWQFFTGKEGLPYNEFSVAAAGRNGDIWLGTSMGAIYFDGDRWEYRQGRTWLPDDEVRDIQLDANGDPWIATAGGIAHIEHRKMTLAEKAAHYEDEMEKYIFRTEYKFVSHTKLKHPGDTSEYVQDDTDNDGLWTSMYGAGECFAYGATKSPEAKVRAKNAFEALRFLQKVTQGGDHAPPKGYVARAVRSVENPDPNNGRLKQDLKKQEEYDTLWKVFEPRWPKSADGKWYWKSDTSSDELDGHYFFYPLYYDLVADSPEEKERVREVVRDLTDHIIENGFALMDHDGTITRWAVYGPDTLNSDSHWWAERGVNSLSILSYLAVAEHITGDEKYHKAARELIEKHSYLQNLSFPKLQWGPGTGNQSDDEMAIMSFYNLVRYTSDEDVRSAARFAFFRYWQLEFPEMNPFFNFAYAAVGIDKTVTDQWGTWSLSPWAGWLNDSMETLEEIPIDRCDWGHKNSQRIDLMLYPFSNSREPYAPDKVKRGYRVDGKCLPAAERTFGHWNTDPWELDYRGGGRTLESSEVFLLPYYMGLYHGFIEERKAN